MIRFVDYLGERFRVLKENKGGMWIISYDIPAAPFFVMESTN